jgi:hypothetical protein
MKTLMKILFLFIFTIYLNNGDIITANRISKGYTWVAVYEISNYTQNSYPSTRDRSLVIRNVKGNKLDIPLSSILFINQHIDNRRR